MPRRAVANNAGSVRATLPSSSRLIKAMPVHPLTPGLVIRALRGRLTDRPVHMRSVNYGNG